MIEDFSNNYAESRALYLFPLLEELCPLGLRDRKNGKGEIIGVKALAVYEANKLMISYPDTKVDSEKTYNTAYKQINSIKNELKKLKKDHLKDASFKYSIDTLIKNLTVELYSLFAVYRKRYNDNYKADVKERSAITNRVIINPSIHLMKAQDVLREAYRINEGSINGMDIQDKIVWQDVACAVALCCGRRMSEIFLTGEFELVDSYKLSFKGQCKGKTRKEGGQLLKEVLFTIPTLVEAKYVLAGIDWLENENRRLDIREFTTEDVNNKYSKGLSRRCKDQWNMMPEGFREISKFHLFRAIYFVCCSANYNNGKGNLIDPLSYAQSILGDDDFKTINAYSRFVLEDESITKL